MSKTVVRLRLDLRGSLVKVQTFRAAARGRRALDSTVQVERDRLAGTLKDGSIGAALRLKGFEDFKHDATSTGIQGMEVDSGGN